MLKPFPFVALSGIRATGRLHLGSLLGAVDSWVAMQKRVVREGGESLFFVADLHSITTGFPGKDVLQGYLRDIVLDLLAVGIDPNISRIYVQSTVPEIAQLAWILGCVTPVGRLMGMHHFAEKREKLSELGAEANASLLTYPVLMAADILGPKATHVPVGADQAQHVELARDVVRWMNTRLGVEVFPEPGAVLAQVSRVPGLGTAGKMSKSDEGSIIHLSDTPQDVMRKFRAAPTDPARKRRTDAGDPDKCHVFPFHTILSDTVRKDWVRAGCTTAGIGCVECKQVLVDAINTKLAPIQERRRELEAKGPSYVDEILAAGSVVARRRFAATLAEVSELIGLHVPTPFIGS